MTNREFDALIMGFAVGSLACLWLGYRLRVRVERWHARGRERELAARRVKLPRPIDDLGGEHLPLAQSVRRVIADRPRRPASELQRIPIVPIMDRAPRMSAEEAGLASISRIPLEQRRVPLLDEALRSSDGKSKSFTAIVVPSGPGISKIPLELRELPDAEAERLLASKTAAEIRRDAVAAIVGAGYKRPVAEAALDACSLAERADGLEQWVAAALRHAAVAKKATARNGAKP